MTSSGMWRRVDLVWTDVPPKRRFTQYLHCATPQNTAFFIICIYLLLVQSREFLTVFWEGCFQNLRKYARTVHSAAQPSPLHAVYVTSLQALHLPPDELYPDLQHRNAKLIFEHKSTVCISKFILNFNVLAPVCVAVEMVVE
jgi:hypothetical protein